MEHSSRQRHHRHWTAALAITLLSLGMGILVSGLLTLGKGRETQGLYETLAHERESGEPPMGGQRDDSLVPEPAVAWIRISNTPVDLPVASGTHGYDWYLHHDLWDNSSVLGCPFMDPQCRSTEERHLLVYGHTITLTDYIFTPLHHCYRQGDFERLGSCSWITREATQRLTPLCALSVDKSWSDILRFDFRNDEELRQWCRDIVAVSTASYADSYERAAHVSQVLTLVTCSSDIANQPQRTLVLFAR